VSCLLEGRLPCYHVEENNTRRKDVSLTGLVRHLQMYFRTHIINSAHKGFRLLPQTRSKHKVRDLEVEIIRSINKQILRLQIPMCHIRSMNLPETLYQLLEVVAGYVFVESACF
jgi:hypothetical protein